MQSGKQSTTQLARDRRMASAILRGDEKALQQFMAEFFPKLYRYSRQRLANDADIDDVVQRTLTQAARRLATYRGEATLLTWLVSICRHEISRSLFHTKKQADMVVPFLNDELLRSAVESIALEHDLEPEAQVQRAELVGLIQLSLDQLPDNYAIALEAKYIEGLSSREIAEKLNISDTATQSLLARARSAFREVCGMALQSARQS